MRVGDHQVRPLQPTTSYSSSVTRRGDLDDPVSFRGSSPGHLEVQPNEHRGDSRRGGAMPAVILASPWRAGHFFGSSGPPRGDAGKGVAGGNQPEP